MIVHQFVPTLEPGAVGAHTLAVRDVLRAAGHTSDDLRGRDRPRVRRPRRVTCCATPAARADVIVYQMAIGSIVADAVLARDEPIVVNHHNLTPMRYIAGWQPVAAHGVAWGRGQLRELADARRARRGRLELQRARPHRVRLHRAPPSSRSCSTSRRSTSSPAPAPRAHRRASRGCSSAGSRRTRRSTTSSRRSPPTAASTTPTRVCTSSAAAAKTATRARSQRFVHALGLDDAVTLTGGVSAGRARRVLPRRRRVRRVQRARGLLRAAARGDAPPRPDRRLRRDRGAGDARRRRAAARRQGPVHRRGRGRPRRRRRRAARGSSIDAGARARPRLRHLPHRARVRRGRRPRRERVGGTS